MSHLYKGMRMEEDRRLKKGVLEVEKKMMKLSTV
jgi:hypothetical protein